MGMFGDMGATATSSMGGIWEMGMTLIGRAVAQGDIDKADAIYQTIIDSIAAEDVPAFEALVAQELPEVSKVLGQGEGRAAQVNALGKLQSFVDQYGLDASARAGLEQSLSAADQRAAGNRQAIQSGMARKGMGGSGSELGALLDSQQDSSNMARQSGLDVAGQARQRALAALGKSADVGGTLRGQDIDVESKNAAAENAREQFNAKMRWAAMTGNNDQKQKDFQNRMIKSNAMNNARAGMARRLLDRAGKTQQDYSSVGRGINMSHQGAAEGAGSMPW